VTTLFEPIPFVTNSQAPIARKLAAFNKHKSNLLQKLQNGHKRRPQSASFDPVKSWKDLTNLAQQYFWGEIMKQNTMPTADRIERLRQLSRALRVACGLSQRAIRDDVGSELYRAWCAKKNLDIKQALAVPMEKDGSSVLTRTADEIKEMVTVLATLQAIADFALAANNVPNRSAGRPALLPRDCIQGLARVYRTSTGSKPGLGAGPFADFAAAFMIAIGRTDFKRTSLIDAIQDAHGRFTRSWFDKKK
jgi:hypothetical protein